MRNVKMKWVVAICAVGLVLGGTSVALAVIDLSTTPYVDPTFPVTSTNVTTMAWDLNVGSWTNGNTFFRIYGLQDDDADEWGIQVQGYTSHNVDTLTGVVNADWLKLRADYGSYWCKVGETGLGITGMQSWEIQLNKYNGLIQISLDGVKLDFINSPIDDRTEDPQPNGDTYPGMYGEPPFYEMAAETVLNTFFADETIDASGTGLCYGVAHAIALGWYPATMEENPNVWEYGVGGSGRYYLKLDNRAGASADNLRPGILGDANLDGTVDDKDASVLSANWLGTGLGWTDGDLNGDTNVDDQDAAILVANWGSTASLEPTSVPEPATWCLLAGALAMLALWRKR